MDRFIGIDGGGTRSTAVVTDAGGTELARVHAGAALIRVGGPASGVGALAELAGRALAECGGALPAAALCCALAGAGREPERQAVAAALEPLGVARRIVVTTDAEAALQDAFGVGPGILLMAGTGSIAWGRAPDGRTARAGGWGDRIGDEGSGYALGLALLRAAVRAHDGRGASTSLLDSSLRETGSATPDALVHWAAAASKAEIAALAPSVLAAANDGDAVARTLVDAAARHLAAHVDALHRRLGPWPGPPALALAGGLAAPGRPLRNEVLGAITSLGNDFGVLEREVDAASGAAALARGG